MYEYVVHAVSGRLRVYFPKKLHTKVQNRPRTGTSTTRQQADTCNTDRPQAVK